MATVYGLVSLEASVFPRAGQISVSASTSCTYSCIWPYRNSCMLNYLSACMLLQCVTVQDKCNGWDINKNHFYNDLDIIDCQLCLDIDHRLFSLNVT